jgi:hypothetical protein
MCTRDEPTWLHSCLTRLCAAFHGFTVERFRIRVSPDQSLVGGSPELFAAVLRPSSSVDAKAVTEYLPCSHRLPHTGSA